jgi:hypothetical protein
MTTQEEEEAVRCFETAEAHVGKENGDGALNGSFVLRAWEGGHDPTAAEVGNDEHVGEVDEVGH